MSEFTDGPTVLCCPRPVNASTADEYMANPYGYSHFYVRETGNSSSEVISAARESFLRQIGSHQNVWFRVAPRVESEKNFESGELVWKTYARGCSW